MNHRALAPALLILAVAAALPASAQTMKPGLWEISSKMHSSDGKLEQAMEKMQKQMANMPPEQRKMMADMMGKQGINMGSGEGGAIAVKMCVTPEMAARAEVPMHQDGSCTTKRTPVTASSMNVSFNCSNPPSSGEGKITFSGDNAYNMHMVMSRAGKPDAMTVDGVGKWLGAACGDIKPLAMPTPK